jgi:hypothetical protein
MNSNRSKWTAGRRTAVALVSAAIVGIGTASLTPALAGDGSRLPEQLSGLLNDYTPTSTTATGTPYEMHGKWTLRLHEERGSATLAVEMTMETADFASSDPSDPAKLSPHTHHISVTDGVIHNDPTDPINWQTACPSFKPPVARGFVVTGTAFVTANGGNPPFGNPSLVTVCILGGVENPSITTAQAFVEFSNFTLQFPSGSPASTHFGTQAINGVVARCERRSNHASNDCRVAAIE